jgi:hypothetical protein
MPLSRWVGWNVRRAEAEEALDLLADVYGNVLYRVGLHLDPLDLLVRRANDEQVLVVLVVGGLCVGEAAGDDDSVIDNHQLVVWLAEVCQVTLLHWDTQFDVRMAEPLRRRPALLCLAGVEHAAEADASARECTWRHQFPKSQKT